MDPLALLVTAVLVTLGLLGVDRLVARFGDRLVSRRPRSSRVGSGGPGLGDLIEIYQPTARFLHEEAERQRHDVVQQGDADPSWTVDLERGTALAPPADPLPRADRLSQIADGVWVATARTWATTTTVVVGDDGRCLVVDPALEVDEVQRLAEEIRSHGWTPVGGFCTHPHWDHVLWSTALGDVPRWATPAAAQQAVARLEDLRADCDAHATGHDHTLTGTLTALADGASAIPWDGPRTVVVPYPAHCRGSAALVLPGSAVLVAGDVLSDVEIPLLDGAADDPVGDYRRTLDVLEAAAARYGVRHLVPGHGHVGDAAELQCRMAADRAYLDALVSGTTPDDARLADPEQSAEHLRQVGQRRG